MKSFNFILFFSLLINASLYTSAQVHVVSPAKYQSFDPKHFGLNGRSTEGPSWTNPAFLELVEQMKPGIVRYPAGTQCNYWDWRTGTFIEGCGKESDFPYTIPMLINGLPENSEIIYVMNMARPTPWTGIPLDAPTEVQKSDSVLQYKIADMLAALNEFEDKGKFPIALELGNEFNFDSEHAAIYAANPSLYLQHAEIIVTIVKNIYPQLKILLITTKGGTAGRDAWNNPVFDYLSEHTEFANKIDGLVQHHYLSSNFGDQTVIYNAPSSINAITESLQYMEIMPENYELIPENFGLWFTEMGASKNNADETWADGLRSMLFIMNMALLGEKVETVLFHHITRMNLINSAEMKLASSGIACKIISEASAGQTQMGHLEFTGDPYMAGAYSALQGYIFQGGNEKNTILVNIGMQEIANISLDQIYHANDSISLCYQWHSDTPWISGVFEGNGIAEIDLQGTKNLTLNPFSITLISGTGDPNRIREIKDIKEKVYPNPFNEILYVENPYDDRSEYKLCSIDGRVIKRGILDPGINMIEGTLKAGSYFLILESPKEINCMKISKIN